MSAGIPMSAERLAEASARLPADQPVVMTNLMKFKAQTTYAPDAVVTPTTPTTGIQCYQERYIPNFRKVLGMLGVAPKALHFGPAPFTLVSDEQFDIVVVLEIPSIAEFTRVINSPEYAEHCLGHRLAATERWQMFLSTPVDVAAQEQ